MLENERLRKDNLNENGAFVKLTSSHLVDLVLDEKKDQWHQGSEEQTGHNLAVLDGTAVVRAERKAAQRPRQSRNKV